MHTDTLTSEVRATIIGISSSILVVLGAITFVVFFIIYRRKLKLNNNNEQGDGEQNDEISTNGGELTTQNVTSCRDDGVDDDVSQTIDICSGENDDHHQASLVALDPEHLSQLSKLFSVTIGKNDDEDDDGGDEEGNDSENCRRNISV